MDPNWLYSTMAQSTASIVGLIGAFVISKVISLSSEKASIKKEIETFKQGIEKLKEDNVLMKDYCDRFDVDEFLEGDDFDTFREGTKAQNIDEFLKELSDFAKSKGKDLNPTILAEEFKRREEEIKKAEKELTEHE